MHEDKTVKLMADTSQFHIGLRMFISGAARSDCNYPFRQQVAVWRFSSAVETTTEDKHRRTTLARKVHHIGATRISLSNRLPMLCSSLKKGHIDIHRLLAHFELARSSSRCLALLGLEAHPCFNNVALRAVKRKDLIKAIYHCNIEDLFLSQAQYSKLNESKKRKDAAAAAKHIPQERAALDYTSVVQVAMQSHFVSTAKPGTIYAVPKREVDMVELSSRLHTPQTKRVRNDEDDDALMDDLEGHPVVSEEQLYFRIVLTNIGRRKTPYIAPGAGGKLRQSNIAVAVRQVHSNTHDKQPIVASSPTSGNPAVNPNYILNRLDGNHDVLVAQTLAWEANGSNRQLLWALKDTDLNHYSHDAVSQVLSKMLALKAYPGSDDSLGMTATLGQEPILQEMLDRGLVRHIGVDRRWFLTQQGKGSIMHVARLGVPRQVFQVRSTELLPLKDMTSYELIRILDAQGFAWQRWVPPSQRTRRTRAIPLGYQQGKPKVWFSTGAKLPVHEYLVCLAKSEDQAMHGSTRTPIIRWHMCCECKALIYIYILDAFKHVCRG